MTDHQANQPVKCCEDVSCLCDSQRHSPHTTLKQSLLIMGVEQTGKTITLKHVSVGFVDVTLTAS